MTELSTDFSQMFSDIDEILEGDEILAMEQKEELDKAKQHTDNADRIQKERDRAAKYIDVMKEVKRYRETVDNVASTAISRDDLGEEVGSLKERDLITRGGYESLCETFGLLKEEAPSILQEQEAPEEDQGSPPMAQTGT